TGLDARTRYFYRFRTASGTTSPTGRTRTAPGPDDEVKVRFAFASCQDYGGRFYNSWQQLVDRGEDLDFVLFLGDYIYETAPAAATPSRPTSSTCPSTPSLRATGGRSIRQRRRSTRTPASTVTSSSGPTCVWSSPTTAPTAPTTWSPRTPTRGRCSSRPRSST